MASGKRSQVVRDQKEALRAWMLQRPRPGNDPLPKKSGGGPAKAILREDSLERWQEKLDASWNLIQKASERIRQDRAELEADRAELNRRIDAACFYLDEAADAWEETERRNDFLEDRGGKWGVVQTENNDLRHQIKILSQQIEFLLRKVEAPSSPGRKVPSAPAVKPGYSYGSSSSPSPARRKPKRPELGVRARMAQEEKWDGKWEDDSVDSDLDEGYWSE